MNDGIEVAVFDLVDDDEIEPVFKAFECDCDSRGIVHLGRLVFGITSLGADLPAFLSALDLFRRENAIEGATCLTLAIRRHFLQDDVRNQRAELERSAAAHIVRWRHGKIFKSASRLPRALPLTVIMPRAYCELAVQQVRAPDQWRTGNASPAEKTTLPPRRTRPGLSGSNHELGRSALKSTYIRSL